MSETIDFTARGVKAPMPIKARLDLSADPAETRVVNEQTGGEKGTKAERWDLLPMDQLAKVARLYAFGAVKYADHNWRKGYAWNLSIGALYRHMAAFTTGEDFDRESQCEHLTSVVFHALALLWFMEAHPELDDRFIGHQQRLADLAAPPHAEERP